MSALPPDLAGCRCCTCRGKHCLVYHPGHDHKEGDRYDWKRRTRLEALPDNAQKKKKPDSL